MKRKEWMSSVPNKSIPVLGILMLIAMGIGVQTRAEAGSPIQTADTFQRIAQ